MKTFTFPDNQVAYVVYLAEHFDDSLSRYYFTKLENAVRCYNSCVHYNFRQFCVELNVRDVAQFILTNP